MEKKTKNKILLIIAIILGVIILCLIGSFFYLKYVYKKALVEPYGLSLEEIEELVKKTSAPANSNSTISEEELKELIQKTTAP